MSVFINVLAPKETERFIAIVTEPLNSLYSTHCLVWVMTFVFTKGMRDVDNRVVELNILPQLKAIFKL